MAWLKADGTPVAVMPHTIQLDIPTEAVNDPEGTLKSFNLLAVIMAVIQLFAAMKSGNPVAIAAALQALIDAFMGK